jgi:hypothetical protein
MSIFTRPDSPPPRQPSPEFVPTPLPSPHLRARLRKSSSKQSLGPSSPSIPPGLSAPRNFIHSSRSYDHLDERTERRRRTSSNPMSGPITPRPLTQNYPTSLSVDHGRRRNLSQATPYRSPPPSPAISPPPPPVPPIPAFVLTPPKEDKPTHPPQSMSGLIRLPDLDNVSPLSESTFIPRQHPKVPPPKHSGMTCLKFFSLRNTKRRVIYTTNS